MKKLKLSLVYGALTFLFITHNNYTYALEQLPDSFTTVYKNMPVLVTGGCGFIGSHLVDKLIELGAHVSILDDLRSGNTENIATVRDKVIYIQGSITDLDTCLKATRNQKIIFHLAAFVSVPASTEDPYTCHDINVTGTQNILEAARINNVKRIVFSSSCAVYGECQSVCCETTPPNPTSPYGFSKLIGEIYCKEYAQAFNMETVSLRYFNVYGDRQDPHGHYAGVIAKFNYNMEHNLPITICGTGMQTRDFVPVNNIVQANILFGACDTKKIADGVFNIATGTSINLFQLIEILKQKHPSYTKDIQFIPARPGDVEHVTANCSKYNTVHNSLFP